MKKILGEINLSWVKLIILAIIAGIYTALMAMLPISKDTSFSDIAVTFEVWILFGIFIIINSKSPIDSALKCFTFFLISQPLVYLIQDFINHSNLFITYYQYWFMWTIATIPMGFIGYYMKKDKWWGLIILAPILILLGFHYGNYLGLTMFSFPKHLLTTIFCIVTMIIYPLVIFKDRKIKITGVIISLIIILAFSFITIQQPSKYDTIILTNGGSDGAAFDDSYKVYLVDESYGTLDIRMEPGLEDWVIHAVFNKMGNTEIVLESPLGEKTIYEINIQRDTYKINKK